MLKSIKQLLILLTTVASIKVAVTEELCTTPGCLQEAAKLAHQLDNTLDPCDDFLNFVCGKLIKTKLSYQNRNESPRQELKSKIITQLTEMIQEPINAEDHHIVKIIKRVFQSCMNETALEEESFGIFKETLKELGGWPVVEGYSWKRRSFHWTKMILQLGKNNYRNSMMLGVDLRQDPLFSTKMIVQVGPPYVGHVEKEHQDAYLKYMTDVALAFGAEPSLASLEMGKVFDFIEDLRKISNNGRFDPTDSNTFMRITLEEFQQQNSDLEWLSLINSVIHYVGGISKEDYLIFPNMEFMTSYFKLLWRTTKRTQANYIIWSIVEDTIPLLPKELKQIKAQYECATGSTHIDHLEFCNSLARDRVFRLPLLITFARRNFPPEKHQQLQDMFDNIKSKFTNSLNKTSWLDEVSKTRTLKKVTTSNEIIGMQGDYFDDAMIDNFYSNEEIEDGSLLNMLANLNKLVKQIAMSEIQTEKFRTELNNLITIPDVNPQRVEGFDSLILPVGLLEETFKLDRPMYLNYGATGLLMGSELVTDIFCEGDSDNENNIWTNQTREVYEEQIECIYQDGEHFDTEIIQETVPVLVTADISALKLSYETYKEWVDENGEEPQLPGIQYTPYQLFWISAMSYECFTLPYHRFSNTSKNKQLNDFEAAAPMRHNPNFAKDFNCPINSRMNPMEKCQVF